MTDTAAGESHHTPRPWAKLAPEGRTWDVIVVGSGIGGMTTAAALAKNGKRVLVLEQHYVPGGYTHEFRRQGFHWDVGVHLVGEMTERSLTGRILSALTNHDLRWDPIGPVYDSFWYPDDFKIGFPDNPTRFAEVLKEAFPNDGRDIDAYLAEVRGTVNAMRGYYVDRALPGWASKGVGGWVSGAAQRALATPTADVLKRLIRNDKLRTVVAGQWGYHGAVPSRASWGLHASIVRHFTYGAYYPVGGASQIAKTLLRTVAEAGGWTRICADVQEIVLEGGRAVGVKMVDGEVIRAGAVVSAIGAIPTIERLLPPEVRDAQWTQGIRKTPSGPAHVCLYLGFEGDIASVGATRPSHWYYNTWDHEQATWNAEPGKPLPAPDIVFTSFPSLKDPAYDPGPKLKHTGEMITFVPYDTFAKWRGTPWRKRGAEYDDFKAAMTDSLLGKLYDHVPGLKDKLVHQELATPISTELFVRPHRGSIYGLDHVPERFAQSWLRPRSPVPGLFLSGSDVSSGGVAGAMMGGLLCAIAMEPIRTMRWLGPVARGNVAGR